MKPAVKAVLGVTCAAAVLFAAAMAGTALIMKAQFRRGDYPFDRSSEHTAFGWYPAFAAEHPREEVEFPSGDLMLKALSMSTQRNLAQEAVAMLCKGKRYKEALKAIDALPEDVSASAA